MLNGIDISRWQAGIDLSSVDADFVIVQASKGLANENAYWRDQAQAALESGKLLGFYHYAKTFDWQSEADWFIFNIRPYIGRCAVFLDWEGDAIKNGPWWAEAWLDYVARNTGTVPCIYMSAWVTGHYEWSSTAEKYPLWLANYTEPDYEGYKSCVNHEAISAWDEPIMQQYTAHGRLDGYQNDLDLDIFHGGRAAWRKLEGGNTMKVEANITNINRNVGGMHEVEWIVIHNTANGKSYEGMAWNNTNFFKDENRYASAHYFIDDGDTVWQCVPEDDRAWHVGEAPSKNGSYNYNSIGIEVCEPPAGEFTDKEKETLRLLVRDLMERYGVDADHVCRHHDVTGKRCPWYYTDNEGAWEELHDYITKEEDMALTDNDVERIADAVFYRVMGYKNERMNGDKDVYQLLTDATKAKVEVDGSDVAKAVVTEMAERLKA